jgi:hypothetical protein
MKKVFEFSTAILALGLIGLSVICHHPSATQQATSKLRYTAAVRMNLGGPQKRRPWPLPPPRPLTQSSELNS